MKYYYREGNIREKEQDSSAMNGCRKKVSKPLAWVFPMLFVLLLTFIFLLWRRTYPESYAVPDYSSLYDHSVISSMSHSSKSGPEFSTNFPPPLWPSYHREEDKVVKADFAPRPTRAPQRETETKSRTPSQDRTNRTSAKNSTDKDKNSDIPIIFGITPTYKRSTQKVDLMSLCHTLMLVPRLVWIVVEDSQEKTGLVNRLLQRCKVDSIHMNIKTQPNARSRGVLQRNTGLNWVRTHCSEVKCNGVVYFMDDDNKYDLRLFEEMRKTKGVSVFPVAFSGGLSMEGPVCENGKAVRWIASFAPQRSIPIDMAGFSINVRLLLENRKATIGKKKDGSTVVPGYLEPEFVGQFATRDTVECRGAKEILVWHTKTQARINNDNAPSAGFEV